MEGHQPPPISREAGRSICLALLLAPVDTRIPLTLGSPAGGGIRNLAQQGLRGTVLPLRKFIEDIADLVIPTPL